MSGVAYLITWLCQVKIGVINANYEYTIIFSSL